MISSLTSRFEIYSRRALYLSAHKAAIYTWKNGDLGSSYLFDANDEGREFFARYLKETPNIPMFVLVDLFEEEFKRDTIPHVLGSDRDAIVARKKTRIFRDTPYFHYTVTGRDQEGRRDDQILLTAVTNPNILRPWMNLLLEHKVPVTGIVSLPLFTQSLLKLLPEQRESMLVVSLQSVSGLRQTFFQDGVFKLSRLVQMPRYGTEPYGPHIREEVERIRRYLNSVRVSTVDEAVDVYMLVTGDLLQELKSQYKDSAFNRYHILDINDLLSAAGSQRRVTSPFSDQLFVHEMLKHRPPNYYGTSSDRKYLTMRKLRFSMLTASALLLLGSAAWGGFTFMDGLSFKQRSLAALNKAQFYEARYQMARERLPQTPVDPPDLQVAVQLADVLSQYKTTPVPTMDLISKGLASYPGVQIDSIQWIASTRPDADVDGGNKSRQAAPTAVVQSLPAGTSKPNYRFYQIAVIKGHIDPFDGNFRNAIATINNFDETLRKLKSVYDVQVLSMPLDTSSSASLQGSANTQATEADFSLKIVIGIGDAA